MPFISEWVKGSKYIKHKEKIFRNSIPSFQNRYFFFQVLLFYSSNNLSTKSDFFHTPVVVYIVTVIFQKNNKQNKPYTVVGFPLHGAS